RMPPPNPRRTDRPQTENRPGARSTGPALSVSGSACGRALDVVLVGLLPGEQRTQLLAGDLDGVTLLLLAKGEELLRAVVLVLDEAGRECAALDVREDLLHALLDTGVDDTGARDVVAELGSVRDRPALLGDAALPHEVDD